MPAILYCYSNMSRHYIHEYLTPSERCVFDKTKKKTKTKQNNNDNNKTNKQTNTQTQKKQQKNYSMDQNCCFLKAMNTFYEGTFGFL
jgi:hypothetical protein